MFPGALGRAFRMDRENGGVKYRPGAGRNHESMEELPRSFFQIFAYRIQHAIDELDRFGT
jgi:hypothetical protein